MIVVTVTAVIVVPSITVVAGCSIVRVSVAEHAQEVSYTAHQLADDA